MKTFTSIFLLFCLTCLPGTCGAAVVFRVQERPQDFWPLQARIVTDETLKDASGLSRIDRALVLARLSSAWWRRDRTSARAWLQKAVAEVELGPIDESASDRRKRISMIRTLMAIVAPLDERAGKRLTALITSEESTPSPEDARDNATSLLRAGMSVMHTDPARAAALGSASLRTGQAPSFPAYLGRLRARDKALGDALFREALAAAANRPDQYLLAGLTIMAFNDSSLSDELRKKVLIAVSMEFVGNSPDTNASRGCTIASTVIPLLEQFDQLLPQQAATIRTGLIQCRKSQATSVTAADNRSKTVDELLEAASKASSRDKVTYLWQAVYNATLEADFERAVTILDSFTEEERKDSDIWDNWRWEYAFEAARARLKKNDRYGMDKIINSTPVRLRPFVQCSVAEAVADHGDIAGAIELLETARKGFLKSDEPNMLDWYTSLLRRYASLAPKEGPQVFREFVKVNNRIAQRPDSTTQSESADVLQPIYLPPALVQTDWMTFKDAIGSLEPMSMRLRGRLGLLESLLELARAEGRSDHN